MTQRDRGGLSEFGGSARGWRLGGAIVLVAALTLGLVYGLVVWLRHATSPDAGAYHGAPVAPPRSVANAQLTDQDGRPAAVFVDGYDATLVFFGYTHCPDECPLAMAHLAAAYRALPERGRVRVVFVTVDPARDMPPVVRRFVRNFDARFVGLTETRSKLAPLWAAYGVEVLPDKEEIGHGGSIYLLDRQGRIALIYDPATSARDLSDDLTRFLSKSTS